MSHSSPHPWSAPAPPHPVVVGVEPGQSPRVLEEAAALAKSLAAGLVCVWVDPTHLVAEREPDESVDLVTVDPDRDEGDDSSPDDAIAASLAARLDPTGVPWRFVYATGEAARGLTSVAEEHEARLIVVGTHRPGLGHWMNQLVAGSVAGRLAHTQRRPVLLVPAPHPDRSGSVA